MALTAKMAANKWLRGIFLLCLINSVWAVKEKTYVIFSCCIGNAFAFERMDYVASSFVSVVVEIIMIHGIFLFPFFFYMLLWRYLKHIKFGNKWKQTKPLFFFQKTGLLSSKFLRKKETRFHKEEARWQVGYADMHKGPPVKTWSAKEPTYCFTDACPDPRYRRARSGIGKWGGEACG